MSSDTAHPHPTPAHPDIRRLPTILKVEAARVAYPTPRTFALGADLANASEGVQVDIHTDDEFPIRAAAPVLFVGKVPLLESERVGQNHYRFHSLGPAANSLKKGDALRLGWASSPPIALAAMPGMSRAKTLKGAATKQQKASKPAPRTGAMEGGVKGASKVKLPEITDRRH